MFRLNYKDGACPVGSPVLCDCWCCSLTEEAHMKLLRFEDINGRETLVNPGRVNHVSDYGSGTTEINFGDKQASVFVAMDIAAVASTLLKAVTRS
jgi:hypothetical protein